MITSIFATFGFAWFILTISFALLCFRECYYVDNNAKNDGAETLTIFAFIGFVCCWLFLGDLGTVFSLASLGTLIGIGVVYLLLGIFWTFIRWYFFCKEIVATFLSIKNDVYSVSPESMERRMCDAGFIISCSQSFELSIKTQDYYGNFVMWFMAWPFSIVLFALDDMLVALGNQFYLAFRSLFQKIADSIMKDV